MNLNRKLIGKVVIGAAMTACVAGNLQIVCDECEKKIGTHLPEAANFHFQVYPASHIVMSTSSYIV